MSDRKFWGEENILKNGNRQLNRYGKELEEWNLTATSLVDRFSKFVCRATGGSFRRTFLCYILLAEILTNLMNSPGAVLCIVFPLAAQMCKDYKVSPAKVMFPLGVTCVACCCILPFGAAIQEASIFFGVIVLFFLGGKIGVPTWLACLLGAVLMVLCGTLTGKQAIAALPVDLAFMLVGALAMAGALTETGAGDIVGSVLAASVGSIHNSYALGAIFFIIPFILTQFMQNQAVINIFAPIVIMTCQSIGANPIGLLVLITAAGLTAYMTPMATSAVPIMMGTGGYDIRSLVKQSWLVSILFAVCYIFFVMTVMPCF